MEIELHSRREFLALTSLTALGTTLAAAAEPASYSEKVLAKKPVVYWRLGEAKGPTAVDATNHKHDGTYHGMPVFRQPGAIAKDTDTAIKLDGKGSYIEVPDHANFSQPTSGKGLTVEVWLRPDALEFDGETADNYVHWLGKGEPGRHEWTLRFYSRKSKRPNRISAYIFNPAGGLGAGAYVEDKLTAGNWIHIVACYDPGDKNNPKAGVSIYRNGTLCKGPTVPGSKGTFYSAYDIVPAHGKAPLRLGTRDRKSFLTGALDEVAIYPCVLTGDEIRDHYATGRKG